nr:MAG TPA: hypothetical protein [Caudoviricetes sp.]
MVADQNISATGVRFPSTYKSNIIKKNYGKTNLFKQER